MGGAGFLGYLAVFGNELLLFCSFWFIVGAIDDIATDLYFFQHRTKRWLRHYRRRAPMRSPELAPATRPGTIAVFIPAWQESGVIGQMLDRCRTSWAGSDYRIYVGVYANDDATATEVIAAAGAQGAKARLVINAGAGPTTKADCLNRLWRAMRDDEERRGLRIKAVALHDAEDVVHPDEIRLFDRLIERKALVQIPVVPLAQRGSRWISGHYCDEFAEAHAKHMVVREALDAAMPSCGVGCAFSREILQEIAAERPAGPFDADSLTEDYELGLRIAERGGRGMMVRMLDAEGNIVGTRACFPASFSAAVRQKARWINGIALSGWDRMGWRGDWRELWMRLHDRRGVFAAIVLSTAYLALVIETLLWVLAIAGWHRPTPAGSVLNFMMAICFAIVLWRLAMRCWFASNLYGLRHGLMAIPRVVVSNTVAIVAARKALFQYIRQLRGAPVTWDKTCHVFPVGEHYRNAV